LRLDKEGFLVDLADWTNATALELAKREHVELTDEHWAVIAVLRDFYQATGVSPSVVRQTPIPSKFSSENPIGSIRLWHWVQSARTRCSSIF